MTPAVGSGPWLIDKSALARLGEARDRSTWHDRVHRGLIRVSVVTVLEMGFSARSGLDWDITMAGPPVSALVLAHIAPRMEDRAIEVQGLLAHRGHHRAPSVADLIIAATAESTGAVVLHVDKDFELIAEVTGQPTERLQLSAAD